MAPFCAQKCVEMKILAFKCKKWQQAKMFPAKYWIEQLIKIKTTPIYVQNFDGKFCSNNFEIFISKESWKGPFKGKWPWKGHWMRLAKDQTISKSLVGAGDSGLAETLFYISMPNVGRLKIQSGNFQALSWQGWSNQRGSPYSL